MSEHYALITFGVRCNTSDRFVVPRGDSLSGTLNKEIVLAVPGNA